MTWKNKPWTKLLAATLAIICWHSSIALNEQAGKHAEYWQAGNNGDQILQEHVYGFSGDNNNNMLRLEDKVGKKDTAQDFFFFS